MSVVELKRAALCYGAIVVLPLAAPIVLLRALTIEHRCCYCGGSLGREPLLGRYPFWWRRCHTECFDRVHQIYTPLRR